MRKLLIIGAMLIAAPAVAFAQQAPAAQAAKTAYSTADTDIGTLLDDPAAKAILEKHIPGLTSNDQVDMARAMTLRDIQQFASDEVTDERLKAIDADLAKLPAKK
jgi:hypothetical protein